MNAFILSLYTGFALYTVFPYTAQFTSGATPIMRSVTALIIFGALVLVSYFLMRKAGVHGPHGTQSKIILLLLGLIFILAVGYQLFAITRLYAFPPFMHDLFSPQGYFFWWLVAPLVGLFFVNRNG